MIPMDRIIGKLDRLYEADDTAGAERLLLYWYEEAKAENDERGMLSLSGELMGLYRKCGRGKEAPGATRSIRNRVPASRRNAFSSISSPL